MSLYEERLESDLHRIRTRVVESMRYARDAVQNSVRALLQADRELAHTTVLADLPLNRDIRELDRLCHAFIARHLPSAGHLRFVSSVMRINIAVERIGDYAVTIAREAVQLSAKPPQEIGLDVRTMSKQATDMLTQTADAFEQANADLARATIGMARQVDTTFDAVFFDLLETGDESRRPLKDLLALFAVFNRLERISDQAKNVCEETIFAATGETKEPKRYRVLFVDERNDRLSLMAQALASKSFPNSGEYASAGWSPADAIQPGFEAFMNERGLSVADNEPTAIARRADFLSVAHVLVSLQGDPTPHIAEIPFHTAVLSWELPAIPEGLDRDREDAALERCYKELVVRLDDLMKLLHGEGAS